MTIKRTHKAISEFISGDEYTESDYTDLTNMPEDRLSKILKADPDPSIGPAHREYCDYLHFPYRPRLGRKIMQVAKH
jgi:hypothetical protein